MEFLVLGCNCGGATTRTRPAPGSSCLTYRHGRRQCPEKRAKEPVAPRRQGATFGSLFFPKRKPGMSVGHRLTATALVLTGLGVTVWASGSIRSGSAQEAAGGPSGMTAAEAITAHETATEGPAQPIPFNHRFHTTELQLQCRYCHTSTDRSQVASMPEMQVCMGCHLIAGNGLEPIDRLREMSQNGQPVQWERVYKLPEFVQFFHEPHLRNEIQCQECHGPVESMDRVYQYRHCS